MTAHKDEIQQLIKEIDQVLTHNNNGLSKLIFNQAQQEKDLFQRIRTFLSILEEESVETEIIPKLSPELSTDSSTETTTVTAFSSLLTQFSEKSQQNNPQTQQSAASTKPVENSVNVGEIKQELTEVIQSLKAELSQMLQDRTNLIQEIRELEQKRLQNYSLSHQLATQEQMISEFLETLMNRLVPYLTSNLNIAVHTSGNFSGNVSDEVNKNYENKNKEPKEQNLEALASALKPILESAERIEQLAHLAKNLDQRLLSLDGTVNTIFEALERNINTYYQSLSQALAKMHSQGMQGEQLMASFLNNLTRYLQQYSLNIEADSEQNVETSVNQENQDLATISPSLPPSQITETSVTDNVNSSTVIQTVETTLVTPEVTEIESVNLANLISGNIADEDDQSDVDAVDELYASFMNFDHPPQISISIPEREEGGLSVGYETSSATIINDLSTVENVNSINNITPLPQQDNLEDHLLVVPNVWNEATEDDPDTSEPTLELAEIFSHESVDELPDSADIITVLTDLVVDIVPEDQIAQNQLVESQEVENLNVNTLVDNVPVNTLPESTTKPQENVSNNASSVYENLLSLLDNDVNNVPEITLNSQQLQQLDQDLDNFDQGLNSHEETAINSQVNSQVNADVQLIDSPIIDSPVVDSPQEEKQDFLPQTITQPIDQDILENHGNVDNVDHNVDDELINATWYLGLDLGTTGISAALFNYDGLVVYPIYWSAEVQTPGTVFQQSFRLPAEVYLPSNVIPTSETVGNNQQLFSAQLKPYLHIGVAYQQERQKWEPVLQLNEFSAGPLIWVLRSLSKLLLTLKSSQTSTTPALIANAVGIDHPTFSRIINKITGVICTCPSGWNEQYRFNVREAILTSKLVEHGQQVLFVEEAIASLLPELDNSKIQPVQLSTSQGFQDIKNNDHPILGNTLSINIGAISTEMTLIDIPTDLAEITYKDFMLHSFGYAGKAIEQDIICQLLLPPKSRQPRLSTDANKNSSQNPWHWQPSIPGLDGMQFSSLKLETLEIPRVAEADTQVRIRLQQKLESSILGQALLDAALALKLILQHQENFTLEFADQHWLLSRRDLESQIFVPFVRRLNRELNKLLVTRGIPTEAINQAIINGGVASVGTINRWLRQKLPNAQIIQNSYLAENGSPNCSRVALGLSMLPLYPQVLNVPKQQYSDYFLFSELLKLLPDRALSFTEVLQLVENRGINTRICQQRLLAFLEGELPPGLIPANVDNIWLTQQSQNNVDYQAIASTPLFTKQGNLSYRPNSQQVMLLMRYLDKVKSSTLQSLDEPYSINLQQTVNMVGDR